MGKRVKQPKIRGNGKYTESEYFQRIRQFLRKAFQYWPPMQLALNKASRPSQSSNKRLKKEYQCNKCKKWYPRKNVQIDHKIECGSLNTYEDIVPFIKRLTVEDVNGYQILCKQDHSVKTKQYLKDKRANNYSKAIDFIANTEDREVKLMVNSTKKIKNERKSKK